MKQEHVHVTHYQSYVLRLWRDGKRGAWRASLQDISTKEVHRFSSIDNLLGFLEAHVDRASVVLGASEERFMAAHLVDEHTTLPAVQIVVNDEKEFVHENEPPNHLSLRPS